MKKDLPEKNEMKDMIYTRGGFGFKRVSKEAIIKNIDALRNIARQGQKHREKHGKQNT